MHGVFWVFLVFITFFLLISTRIKWWVRLCLGIYQIVVFVLYTKAYNKIVKEYDQLSSTYDYDMNNETHVANRENYLDARGILLGEYEVYIHLPFIIFLIVSYYKWIKNCDTGKQLAFIILSIVPVGIVYFVITIFMFMYLAYQP